MIQKKRWSDQQPTVSYHHCTDMFKPLALFLIWQRSVIQHYFFFHNKSANNTFSYDFSARTCFGAKRTVFQMQMWFHKFDTCFGGRCIIRLSLVSTRQSIYRIIVESPQQISQTWQFWVLYTAHNDSNPAIYNQYRYMDSHWYKPAHTSKLQCWRA
jgi:hypothetical protein